MSGKSQLSYFSFLPLLLLCACSDSPQATTKVAGIDVSHYQQNIDWDAVKQSGISFSYIKVSEGETITDPQLEANWTGATTANLRRGGYHVFIPGDDGKTQAQQFLNSLASVRADYNGALQPALDIESIPKEKLFEARQEIKEWLDHIEAELGCKPIIYTSPDHWNDDHWNKETLQDFTSHSLWLANYAETPTLPNGWQKWTFWQYDNKGNTPGITTNVDHDYFSGSTRQLALSTCVGW